MQHGIVPAPGFGLSVGPFSHTTYTIKRPFWSLLGRRFRVFAPDGSLVLFVKHPLLRLRPEFTMYADEEETQPIMTIKSRQVIAINRAHDVFDARTGERLGTIRSRGLKSILRDTWDILDPSDQPVGMVQEEGAAMLRRFFPILTGQWRIELGGDTVARIRQIFRFFIKEFSLDLSMNRGRIDPRFAVACTLLALMAESRRESSG